LKSRIARAVSPSSACSLAALKCASAKWCDLQCFPVDVLGLDRAAFVLKPLAILEHPERVVLLRASLLRDRRRQHGAGRRWWPEVE
jgi:hypothetical protein